jgi:WD40 repeat protein
MANELSAVVSLRVDFNFSEPCFVLKLASNNEGELDRSAGGTAVAALSNHAIKVFSSTPTDLRHVSDFKGHADRINDVSFPQGKESSIVVSSSSDSTVRCWDCRSPGACERCAALP